MTDNRSDSAVSASDLGNMSSGAATTIMGLGKTADGSKNIGGYFLSFIEDGSNSAVNGSTSLSVTRIGRTTASDSDWKVLPDAAGTNTYHYAMSPLNNAAGGIGNVGYIAFSSTGDAVPELPHRLHLLCCPDSIFPVNYNQSPTRNRLTAA